MIMEHSLNRLNGAASEHARHFDNSTEVGTFVKTIHDLAASMTGKGRLVVASFGQNPTTGVDLTPKVEQFDIGDIAGMTKTILSLSVERHRNVYVPMSIVRPETHRGKKGTEADIVAVLGLVADFDDDDAWNYESRLPIEPSMVLETSEGRFQAFILFDHPVPLDQAKPIAQRLKQAAQCDHGTADCSHVWRVPNTPNWPNKKKVDEGRSPDPQTVRVAADFFGQVHSVDDLNRALPIREPSRPQSSGQSKFSLNNDKFDLPKGLIDLMAEPVTEGDRSDRACAVIRALLERGWSDDEIVNQVQRYPDGFVSRYNGNEKRLIADVLRLRGKPLNPKPDRYNGHSEKQQRVETPAAKKDSKSDGEEWPMPVPLQPAVPPSPPLPMDCLPHLIASMIKDESERMQSPPDLLAIPVLVTLAGCIGSVAALRPKAQDDWAERPCFWAMIIGMKGVMKSPAISFGTAPLRRLQKLSSEDQGQKKAEWLELKAEADLRLKAWEKECERLMKDRSGGYDAELPPKPRAYEELPEEPVAQRFLTQDVTVEKIMEVMKASKGMTLSRDELAGFMLNMSRYTSGSDRQFYLECYSGGTYTSDRIGRGETTVADLYLNIVGGIQPSVARKLFSVEDGSDDGFFERFGLMAYPDLPKTWELVDRRPDSGLRNSYHNICETLSKTDWATTLHTDAEVEAGPATPYARFCPEAQEMFNDWLTEHMIGIRNAGESQVEGFMNKQRGLLVRLALVIHLTAYASGEETDPRSVSEKSLSRALLLVEDYLVPTWRRVLAAFGKTQTESASMRIARSIIEKRMDGIRVGDVLRNHWSGMRDRAAIEEAFDDLVARDWLAAPEKAAKKGGGRPSETYRVNPRVFDMEVSGHE
jgi:hypothetical protein